MVEKPRRWRHQQLPAVVEEGEGAVEEHQRELGEQKWARQGEGEVAEEAVGRWAPAVNLEQRRE